MSGCQLQIAVVGGSIAGCCAAVELARSGHAVDVFERSASALIGQGAGIGLHNDTLEGLLARDLIDSDLPRLQMLDQALLAKTGSEARMGRESLRVRRPAWTVNWADLHRNFRARVPAGAIGLAWRCERCQSPAPIASS
jgi:2-polyprenyl-6-methoxyphenol hydroxylase-like FAD-dependent oxidoreductase